MSTHEPTVRQLEPADSKAVPRYAGIASFMRAPFDVPRELIDIGVFGIPLDMTTFRSGTREGPAAVREASRAIRRINASTGIAPFDVANVADIGDLPVHGYNFAESGPFETTARFVEELRADGIFPLAIGGDHSISIGMLRGLAADGPLGVVQFDSHADIQDEYFGTRDNHATLMRRAHEEGIVDPRRVIQLGLRGSHFDGNDVAYSHEVGYTVVTYDDYEEMGRAAAIELIRQVIGDGPTYITYDVDGLDPTQAPGTAAREPGGFSMRDSQVMLRGLTGAQIVGADVNEVSPPLDPSGLTALNAANLVFELTCLLAATPGREWKKGRE